MVHREKGLEKCCLEEEELGGGGRWVGPRGVGKVSDGRWACGG